MQIFYFSAVQHYTLILIRSGSPCLLLFSPCLPFPALTRGMAGLKPYGWKKAPSPSKCTGRAVANTTGRVGRA